MGSTIRRMKWVFLAIAGGILAAQAYGVADLPQKQVEECSKSIVIGRHGGVKNIEFLYHFKARVADEERKVRTDPNRGTAELERLFGDCKLFIAENPPDDNLTPESYVDAVEKFEGGSYFKQDLKNLAYPVLHCEYKTVKLLASVFVGLGITGLKGQCTVADIGFQFIAPSLSFILGIGGGLTFASNLAGTDAFRVNILGFDNNHHSTFALSRAIGYGILNQQPLYASIGLGASISADRSLPLGIIIYDRKDSDRI